MLKGAFLNLQILQFSGGGGGGFALRPPSGFRPLVFFWSLVTAYLKGDMLSLRMALTSDNLALPLIFLNLLRWHLSKFSQFGNIILPIIQKPKKLGLQWQFPRYMQFCVFSLHLNLFYGHGTRKGTNMLDSPANLGKFHRSKRDKSCLKDPYFLYSKTLRNGTDLHHDHA